MSQSGGIAEFPADQQIARSLSGTSQYIGLNLALRAVCDVVAAIDPSNVRGLKAAKECAAAVQRLILDNDPNPGGPT